MKTVAIVGVGLIGGSFALALRRAGFSGTILGVSSEATIRAAIAHGVIDRGVPLAEAAGSADLIYLAQPIGRIVDTLHHLDPLLRHGALVTDAGSTKGAICALAAKTIRTCQFLGGHPLAGKEKRGVTEADANLFAGRVYVVTPGDASELETTAAREFLEWVSGIGARALVLSPEEHDRVVSFTSHLAQLASTALAGTVAECLHTDDELAVSGPGLADTTRLALSSYDLWRDILATNTGAIERALAAYIQKLEHFRDNLRTRQLEDEFEQAAWLAARLRGDRQ